MDEQSERLGEVYLARHGETAWTLTGQHTGRRNDLPLTENGERNARALGARLRGVTFDLVLTSPHLRARQTCDLAGFGSGSIPGPTTDPDIAEWDYGVYDGRTTAQIRRARPNWDLFRNCCPGGESPLEILARADRVIARVRPVTTGPGSREPPDPAAGGRVLLFGHGHFFRALAARWIGMPVSEAHHFLLSTAALSILGYEHTAETPAIVLWNDVGHVAQ